MNLEKHYRNDLLYRVIDETVEMQLIEDKCRTFFDRLKKINSLGVVPEVIEMAKYSKYEHAIGTIHQINCLVEIDENNDANKIDKKYYRPLKISAEFLHLGHFPFTYSTERALLLAFIIFETEKIRKDKEKIEKIIQSGLKFHDIDDSKKAEFLNKIFSLKGYKYLYKFHSIKILLENWKSFFSKFDHKKMTESDKKIIINNLTNDDSPGNQYLVLADKADYVQRDALYFGTIKIDISPKHLYQNSLRDIFQVTEEEEFLDHNLQYLYDAFYNKSEVISFTRLYEKIVASLIQSEKFDLKWLENYDDDSFKWLICKSKDKSNKKIDLPQQWVERADKLFNHQFSYNHIFQIQGVQLPKGKSIVDIEHHLIGIDEPKTTILSYPFERGILVSLDYSQIEFFDDTEYFTQKEEETQYIDIDVFQNKKQQDLTELVKIIANLSDFLSPEDKKSVREGLGDLLSWTGKHKIKNYSVLNSIAEALKKIDDERAQSELFIIEYIDNLSKNAEFEEFWKKPHLTYWKEVIVVAELKKYIENSPLNKIDAYCRILTDLLDLPIKLLQSESSKRYLEKICETLIKKINEPNEKDKRGNYFEALSLINRIMNSEGAFQFFINGHTIVNQNQKQKEDKNEYDIIEIRLNNSKKAELWIYCCSISAGIEANNKTQLNHLYTEIRKRFPDLTIRTRFLVPENSRSKKWTPLMKETGMNTN
jgi:HD superfamily phosphohydrolase